MNEDGAVYTLTREAIAIRYDGTEESANRAARFCIANGAGACNVYSSHHGTEVVVGYNGHTLFVRCKGWIIFDGEEFFTADDDYVEKFYEVVGR